MKTAIPVLLAFVLCSTPVGAQTVHFKYMGPVDCGTWDMTGGSDGISRNAVKLNLILGFLIGKSFGSKRDLLANVTVAGVNAWMSQYCSAHPLENVMAGMGLLEAELSRTAPPTQ